MTPQQNKEMCEEIEQKLYEADELFSTLDIGVRQEIMGQWENSMIRQLGTVSLLKLKAYRQENND